MKPSSKHLTSEPALEIQVQRVSEQFRLLVCVWLLFLLEALLLTSRNLGQANFVSLCFSFLIHKIKIVPVPTLICCDLNDLCYNCEQCLVYGKPCILLKTDKQIYSFRLLVDCFYSSSISAMGPYLGFQSPVCWYSAIQIILGPDNHQVVRPINLEVIRFGFCLQLKQESKLACTV